MDKWDMLRLDLINAGNWEDRFMKQSLDAVLELYAVPIEDVRFPLLSGSAGGWYKIAEERISALGPAMERQKKKALLHLVKEAGRLNCSLVADYDVSVSVVHYMSSDTEYYLCTASCSATGIASLLNHKGDR